jgi:hypothetical protein
VRNSGHTWNENAYEYVRFQVLTAASMQMAVFRFVALCSLVEVYRRFRDACCFHQQGDEMSANFYQTTRRNNPEDSHLHMNMFFPYYSAFNLITFRVFSYKYFYKYTVYIYIYPFTLSNQNCRLPLWFNFPARMCSVSRLLHHPVYDTNSQTVSILPLSS